jgi:integrase/recombinase XerC
MSDTPRTLTDTEITKLLAELRTYQGTPGQKALGVRNWFAAVLMLEAGLRVGEVVHLKRSALWFNGQPVDTLLIPAEITKTKQERQIPVSDKLKAAITDLHSHFWSCPSCPPSPYALRHSISVGPLSTRTLERIIRAAALQAIGRPVHPHVLRHTFATRLMRVTNARVVQELLGHKHMTSTQIYCNPNAEDLRTAINNAATAQPPA